MFLFLLSVPVIVRARAHAVVAGIVGVIVRVFDVAAAAAVVAVAVCCRCCCRVLLLL